jgi:hypothetical protein
VGTVVIVGVTEVIQWRRRKKKSLHMTEEIKETHLLPDLKIPLTARAAFKAAMSRVREYDRRFKFTFIASGESFTPEGLAYSWEMFFELPGRAALAICTVRPHDPGADPDDQDVSLKLHIRPWPARESQRALPLDFIDSPEAMRLLAERGADFISGDGHMILASKILEAGEAAWFTESYGQKFYTPFGAL